MTHTIDTKAIQELAATCPEARAYLEREFPQAFWQEGDYLFTEFNNVLVIFDRFTNMNTFTSKHILSSGFTMNGNWSASAFHKATTQEIQRFIPDYKPNV